MTNGDTQLELTLELAQRARAPSAADEARNLAALRARLGLPGAPGADAKVSTASTASAANTAPSNAAATPIAARALGGKSTSGLSRLVGASTFTGVAGFLLGLLVAPTLRQEPRESPVAARTPAAVEPASGADVRAAAPVEAEPQAASAPPVEAEAAASPRAARRAPPRAPAVPRPKAAANAPDFLEAVRWLRRAQRAERRGEGALALSLLEQIDERFPPELLGEERQATRVLGLCGTGEPEKARELARELLAKSPRSIYAERLRASCAAPALGGEDKENDPGARE